MLRLLDSGFFLAPDLQCLLLFECNSMRVIDRLTIAVCSLSVSVNLHFLFLSTVSVYYCLSVIFTCRLSTISYCLSFPVSLYDLSFLLFLLFFCFSVLFLVCYCLSINCFFHHCSIIVSFIICYIDSWLFDSRTLFVTDSF